MFGVSSLFDLSGTDHGAVFDEARFAWDGLRDLISYVDQTLQPHQAHTLRGRAYIEENVSIGEGTMVEEGAMIQGPSIIGRNCQIRHNAYIRPYSVIGDACVIGNASEIKHALIFNESQIPHFNYVGDSILGRYAHLGAGVKNRTGGWWSDVTAGCAAQRAGLRIMRDRRDRMHGWPLKPGQGPARFSQTPVDRGEMRDSLRRGGAIYHYVGRFGMPGMEEMHGIASVAQEGGG